MKRIFLLFLILCTLLSGCSQPPEPTQPVTQAQPPLVGLCFRDRSQNPDDCAGLEMLLTDAGYRLSVADSGNDQARQDTQIQSMIQEGCRLILCEPVMVTALDTVLDATEQAGLPLILLNYQPDAALLEGRENLSYIGFDPAAPAVLQAQAVQLLPDGGDLNGDGVISYAIVTGPEDHLDAQLHIQGAQWETGELLATEYTDWSKAQGQAACGRLLSQYGLDLEVILCGSADLAQGALQAVEASGWRAGQDGYLLALGGGEVLTPVVQGSIASTILPDTEAQKSMILETVAAMLADLPAEAVSYAPYITVTQDTAAEFLP